MCERGSIVVWKVMIVTSFHLLSRDNNTFLVITLVVVKVKWKIFIKNSMFKYEVVVV